MKNVLLFLFLFFTISINAQLTYVPDDNFEQALIDLGYDSGDLDNHVLTANISTVVYLDVSDKSINDLSGIEDFTDLERLLCSRNNLSNLDLSACSSLEILHCFRNNLLNLDLSSSHVLNQLLCSYNDLTTLDLSQCFAIEDVDVFGNNLTNLNVSQCTNLRKLRCNFNQLSILDVSDCIGLEELYCNSNSLQDIDITNNVNLTRLACGDNPFTSIDLTNNILLDDLHCVTHQLQELDLSKNGALEKLLFYNGQLPSLDLSQNNLLQRVQLYNNNLQSLDIRNGNNTLLSDSDIRLNDNPNLECVYVDDSAYSTSNWATYIDNHTTFVETEEQCNALGVNDFSQNNNISIYPNPVKEFVTIKSKTGLKNVEAYNILGKKVNLKKDQDCYSVSHLSNGIYFLNIQTVNGIVKKKLIIE